MTNIELDYDVCIIGSGVAGLSAALSLQGCGFRVAVFERDADFIDRKQGYGLTLTYSTNGPLSKLGVLEECIVNNCPSHCHYVFNPKGDVIGYYGRELKVGEQKEKQSDHGGNRGNLRIPRQDLRMMLIQKLKPETVQWGWSMLDYHESVENVSVTFKAANSEEPAIKVINTLVLVGSDGIRSKVRQLRDQRHFLTKIARNTPTLSDLPVEDQTLAPIHYLGVAVIIGLSSTSNIHIDNRGFYVVDGENRMFTMPYVAPIKVDTSEENAKPGLTMWQLSFSGLTEEEATKLRKSKPVDIITEALRRTEGWFSPVQEMIKDTLNGELWATGLYDRDPLPLFTRDFKGSSGAGGSRVTVIGDAAHPMSMFKGQGANQALADGPLLAQWLCNAQGSGRGGVAAGKRRRECSAANQCDVDLESEEDCILRMRKLLQEQQTVFTRLRCFERDMKARTQPKVLASREAALHLHSPAVLDDVFGISGVDVRSLEYNRRLLQQLSEDGINAALGEGLDAQLKVALEKYKD